MKGMMFRDSRGNIWIRYNGINYAVNKVYINNSNLVKGKNSLQGTNVDFPVIFSFKKQAKGSTLPKEVDEKSVQYDPYPTVVTSIASSSAPQSTTALVLATPVLTLPAKYQKLTGEFNSITDESGLTKQEKQKIVLQIIQDKSLNINEATILLQAASQNFPLIFTSEATFKNALNRLVAHPSEGNTPKKLNAYSKLAELIPPCILIHGSSVGGVRHKKKDGRGWAFDDESDIDISIVDNERFLWAQLLGITTYGNCNTIELSDIHIKLLKLKKFVAAFRQLTGRYPANFGIYKNESDARKHSGFSLVCKYNPALTDFTIEKIYVESLVVNSEPNTAPIALKKYFTQDNNQLRLEQWANVTALEEKASKRFIPSQGNHVFNDLHAHLAGHITLLEKIFHLNITPDTHHYNERSGIFLGIYFSTLKLVVEKLEFCSRELAIAEAKHGKENSSQIVNGFQVESNAINDFIFGNACTYFSNCSFLLCKIITEYHGTPLHARPVYFPIKKSFSALLDSIIDEQLVNNLRILNNKTCKHVISEVEKFTNTLRAEINTTFKRGLDDAFGSIPSIFKLIRENDSVTIQEVLYALEDGAELEHLAQI